MLLAVSLPTTTITNKHIFLVSLDIGHIATLGPEERPILSQRDEGWAKEWLYFHQPASQPASQPANQQANRPPILQNIQIGISQQPLIGSSSNFKIKFMGPNQNLKLAERKTTLNGRRPQNIKDGISQQVLIRSSSNFKLKVMGQNQN
jgi:hypothetical protein